MASKDWGNEIEVYLDERDLAQQVDTSLSLAKQMGGNPDQEAELRAASQKLGIPIDTARNMPDETRQAAERADFDPFDFSTKSPATARYLANPDNAALSNDEIPVLGALEQAIRKVGLGDLTSDPTQRAAEQNMPGLSADRVRERQMLQTDGFAAASRLAKQNEQRRNQSTGIAGDVLRPESNLSNVLSGLGTSTATAFKSQRLGLSLAIGDALLGPDKIRDDNTNRTRAQLDAEANLSTPDFDTKTAEYLYGGFQSLAQTAPALAASIASGTAAPALIAAGLQVAGEAYGRYRGRGAAPGEALLGAGGETIVEVLTEKLPLSYVVNRLGKAGFGEFMAGMLGREMIGEQVATLTQDAIDTVIANPEKTWADYLRERPEAAVQTAFAVLVQAGTLATISEGAGRLAGTLERRQEAADTALSNAQSLDELMVTAAASMTRQRSPEGFAQLVQDAAERSGTAPAELFIDAQPLMQIIQNAGMTQEQLSQILPSVAEQLDEAIATDGTLTIPIGEATAAFAGTGFEQELVRHSRVDANALSAADAEQAGATIESLSEEAEQIIAEQQDKDAWEASSRVVFNQINSDLNTAGRFTPEVNRTYATVARDYYTVQAAKMGITPEQLYTQFPLTTRAARIGERPVLDQKMASESAKSAALLAANSEISRLYMPAQGDIENLDIDMSDLDGNSDYFDQDGDPTQEWNDEYIRRQDAKLKPATLDSFDRIDSAPHLAQYEAFVAGLDAADVSYTTSTSASSSRYVNVAGKKIRFSNHAKTTLASNHAKPDINVAPGLASFSDAWAAAFSEKFAQSAYHGSPYRFEKFSLDHIGSGEGAQAYGWGLYFASRKEIGEFYLKSLSGFDPYIDGQAYNNDDPLHRAAYDAFTTVQSGYQVSDRIEGLKRSVADLESRGVQWATDEAKIQAEEVSILESGIDLPAVEERPEGQLYRVDIPEDGEFLLWDKPLSEQSPKVREAIVSILGKRFLQGEDSPGADLYRWAGENISAEPFGDGDKGASLLLKSLGIAGIKYMDGMSRDGEGDSFNYVVFDESAVQIAETFYQSTQSTALPDTIDIDGVQRPTTNNTGKPLAQTEEGVRNFWRWFGDSKVVDAQGRPLVVYHGSPQGGFDEFGDENNKTSFFTSRYDVAASYAGTYDDVELPELGAEFYDENKGVYSVYLRIENPKTADWNGAEWGNGPDGLRTDEFVNRAKREGLDGAIMENVVDTGWLYPGAVEDAGDSTIYAVFDPAQIKSATDNSGEFDPANPSIVAQQESAPRATFDPASLNIALLEKADLSSFLHELGHAFFEISAHLAARQDAPQAIKDDIQTLFTTTGYTGTVQEWLALPVNDRRIAHETIAESFEQYLLDGKAPTLEQQALFSKMRSWMVSVYRTLADFLGKNTNAKLTAEVASVFDRMLATDDAIAAAKLARAATPLFASAEQAGMTPEQFADYQRAVGDTNEEAVRELDSRSLRDLKWLRTARGRKLKELQADATAKRRNARIEARRQLLNQPTYRAMTFLRGKVSAVPVEKRSGKKLDTRRDDIATAIAKLGGLNKEAAIAEFGLDPKSFLNQRVGEPVLRAGKAGKTPDAMAEALAELGYLQTDGNEKHDLNDLSDKLHDQDRGISHYSLEADWDLIHGYKTLPAPDDAEAATFSAGRLSLPELEARFANRPEVDWAKLGIGRRGMIQKMGMPMDLVAEVTGFSAGEDMVLALIDAKPLNEATEELTDRIMLERYGDITSPEALEQAADAALASEARSRMVSAELARLNTAVGSARIVQTVAKQTAQQVVARQKIRHVRPDKSAGAVARAGKGAEAAFRRGDVDTAAGFKRSQVLNAAIEREQRQARTEIDKARDNFSAMFGSDKRSAKTRDMNLVNAARAMVAQYGLSPEVGGQRATDYLELIREYNPNMAENIKALMDSVPEAKDYRELTVEEFRGMRDAVLGIYQMSRRVMQTRIDGKLIEQDEVATKLVEAVIARNGGELPASFGAGGTPTYKQKLKLGLLGLKAAGTRVEQWADGMGGEVKRIIYHQVSDAAVQARSKRNELISQYKLLLEQAAPGMTYTPIVATEFGGYKFNAGKSELLHALLHTGNPSNFRKLLLGNTREGFAWGGLDLDGNLDTSRWDAFIQRMVDEGVLTKADFDFAQGVWDLLETVKQDAQRAHFDIYGYYFNEVTAAPIQTPFGEYRGGYVPALVDPLQAPEQQQKQDAEASKNSSTMFPTTGKGFTKARVEYNRPLELDLRTIGSHLDKVARFAYLEPAIHDASRLLQNRRVASALNRLDPNIISKMLMPWLERAAKQTTSLPTRFPLADKFCRGLRSRTGMYLMFANVINATQQVTGLSVAAVKVPAPKLLRALKAYTSSPSEMSRLASEMSPWLRDRLDNQSFEMSQQIEKILANPGVLDKSSDFMKRNAYFMQTGVQNVMDVVVWWGAHDHAMSQSGTSDLDAVRFADEVVRTTQGTFSPEDVSAMEVQIPVIQLFSQFWGYFNMLANTLGTEAGKAVREMGYKAATPRLLFIWFAGMTIPAVIGQMIAQGIPDDDDDEDGDGVLDEWLAMFFGSQAKTLAAMVPGVGQLSMLVANQFDDKVYNDRLNLSPGFSLIDSAASGSKALLQGTAFDERLTKKEVRDVATLVALATGAPTNVIAKPVGYLLDVEEGRKNPEGITDYAIGLTTGR